MAIEKTYFCGEIKAKMEDSKRNMVTYAMQGGLVLALSVVSCMVIGRFLPVFSALALMGVIASYFLVIHKYGKLFTMQEMAGEFRFSHAFMMGSYISFFSSMLLAVAMYIYLKSMGPDLYASMLDEAAKVWESVSQTEQQKEMVAQFRRITPVDMTFSTMWCVLFHGLVVSLLVSLFRKLKNI